MSRVSQSQLVLPLLSVLDEHPRGLSTTDAVAAVAERVGIAPADRDRAVALPSGAEIPAFHRDVRWVRQGLVRDGQVDGTVRNLWRLTVKGKRDLRMATPGVVVTIYETALGRALWAEAESALGLIEDGSVQTWMTSPPYPLEGLPKSYGGLTGNEYIDWLGGLCKEMHRCLRPDGSLFLNLGDVWVSGQPTMSLYQEKLVLRLCEDLGYHLAQRIVWWNTARLPAPAEYVTVRRVRVNQAAEHLWWLSKTPNPKADNRRVLQEYSASMRKRIAAGGERAAERPSGYCLAEGAFARDNGGSIPPSVLAIPHTASNTPYHRYCRDQNLPRHPARFPDELAEFGIKLTSEPGDLIGDAFSGSFTTAAAAERLGRSWVGIEKSLTYIRGSLGRFPHAQVAV